MDDPSSTNKVAAEPGNEARAVPARSLGPVATAVWCGIAVGLAQLLIILGRRFWLTPTASALLLNRDEPWMILASSVILFGTCGVLLAPCARAWPGVTDVVGSYLLVFLAALALLLTIPAFAAFASALLAGGIAKWIAPSIRQPKCARWLRRGLPVVGALGVGLFVSCAGRSWWDEQWALWRLPPSQRGTPNVLLVVLDTVRADHLSAYDYARQTTPNLARLACRGVRFEHAVATAPWTLPSHASLLTGCWPHELAVSRALPLETDVPTLAETFAARGYRTAGIVANQFFCSRTHGLSRGFAHYEDRDASASALLSASSLGWLIVHSVQKAHAQLSRWLAPHAPFIAPPDLGRKDAGRINRDALRWLDQHPGRPFFLFLNYFDAHDPYIAPRTATRHFGLRPANPTDVELLHEWPRLDKSRLSAHEVQLAADSYDDCIAYLDEHLGRLFDELERRQVLDNTVVIVTADHGEQLGEHQLFGHGVSLYQPEVHVPLLIVYPPSVPRGLVVREPVSLRDIPATVARIALSDKRALFPGSSLTRAWSPTDRATAERESASFSEVQDIGLVPEAHGKTALGEGPLEALTTETESYIRHRNGREELYDHGRDPGELRNLADHPESQGSLQEFRRTLDRIRRGSRSAKGISSPRKAGRQRAGRLVPRRRRAAQFISWGAAGRTPRSGRSRRSPWCSCRAAGSADRGLARYGRLLRSHTG